MTKIFSISILNELIKISFLKFAEIDDEKTIGDYNLSEENAGIYLPD